MAAEARVSLNSPKVRDLGARTPLFPFEDGRYVLHVERIYKHDTTHKDNGEFNPYGSLSYRARVQVRESTNANIRVGAVYELIFAMFDKGYKGEKASGKMYQLVAAILKESGNHDLDGEEGLDTLKDKDLGDDALVEMTRKSGPVTFDDKKNPGQKITKVLSDDTFQQVGA